MQQGAPPVICHVGVGAGADVGGEGLHVLVHNALDDVRLDRLGAVKEGGARGTQDVHAAAVAEPHRPDESVRPEEVQGVDVGLVLDQDPQDLLQAGRGPSRGDPGYGGFPVSSPPDPPVMRPCMRCACRSQNSLPRALASRA